LSEFPIGSPPVRDHFPRRNRLISGLSIGTLVIEASVRSGSLITARFAAEQGREVFAIPGSIRNPLSGGCHKLIREGAKLVEGADDIVEELDPWLEYSRSNLGINSFSSGETDAEIDEIDRVFECIGYEPTSIDDLASRSGLAIEMVSSILVELELQGRTCALPSGLYTRTE